MPGLFISFEGIDGSGKSTQAHRLAEILRASGREVVLTREPGGSAGAEEIRALVLQGDPARWSAETELLLFTAARRDHLERVIRPALADGQIVICDRFADSTRLYQGTSRGDLRAKVDALHALMIGIEPDLTLLIDMDPARGLARSLDRLGAAPRPPGGTAEASQTPAIAAADRAEGTTSPDPAGAARHARLEDRFETFGASFQNRMRAGFLALAREFPDRFVTIDGNRDRDAVAQDVRVAAEARLA